MAVSPSLLSLCMQAVKIEIGSVSDEDDDLLSAIYELPSDLFDSLLLHLSPVALQKLQDHLPSKHLDDHESTYECHSIGGKHGRYDNFNNAWRALFESRWPELVMQPHLRNCLTKEGRGNHELTTRWQEKYWETHLQDCLDEAVELALIPSFCGCISEIIISDVIVKSVGSTRQMSYPSCGLSNLSHHCQQFGYYVRCLRLQNVLFNSEICHLLKESKLESLVLCRIKSEEHVDGLCKLLNQNRETLIALEFNHCSLSSTFVDAICGSLCISNEQTSRIQHFSVRSSGLLERNPTSLPAGFVSLLTGRQLYSLNLCENQLGRNFAAMAFETLLEASSCLSILDLSENNISGWLSNIKWRSCYYPSSLGKGKILQSLRVLNLRGNNLRAYDVASLNNVVAHMPNLETLDLSDNPIEDDGLKILFSYLIEASERNSHIVDLKLEKCDLSCDGVTLLLGILSTLRKPLNSLSVADNELGSQIAVPLGKYLCNFVEVLNIRDIGLGSSGFLLLQRAITKDVKLVRIDFSNNRGGIETTNFLSRLFLWAPDLVEVNAGYNIIPAESIPIICSAIQNAKGKLECLDLRGNFCHYQPAHASMLSKFQRNGKPVVLFSNIPASNVPYDDDP